MGIIDKFEKKLDEMNSSYTNGTQERYDNFSVKDIKKIKIKQIPKMAILMAISMIAFMILLIVLSFKFNF